MHHSLLDDVRDSLRRADLGPEDCLLIGLSGGIDSQTLTHALVTLRNLGEGPVLKAVHVDHRLRVESEQNARDCSSVAHSLGVPLDVARVDVRQWDQGDGVEAAARTARYAVLATAAQRAGTSWIALGHSLDDQVETVLLRLARGSSLDGVSAMREISQRTVPLDPSRQPTYDVWLLRPLINRRRIEIEAYAQEHGLVAIDDPSNADTRYRRNAVRHQVIPVLEQIVPGAARSISRSSRLLAEDAELLSTLAADSFEKVCCWLTPCIAIDRESFRELAVPLQRRVIVMCAYALSNWISLSSERVEALRQAAISGDVSRVVEVGEGLAALIDYHRMVLGQNQEIKPALRANSGLPLLDPDTVIHLLQPQSVRLDGGWVIEVHANGLIDGWTLRTRRPGDRMETDGNSPRRLQDWFVNQKIPGYLRDHIPLLTHNGVVRWVPGFSLPSFEDVDSGLVARLTNRTEEDQTNDERVAGYPSA